MSLEAQIVAFEGGKLRRLASGETSREAVLALPLNRLLVKMVRVPAETDPVEFSAEILQAMSPFPDEELTVSCETVREGEDGKIVIAAALPESAADDIGEALDAEKLSVVRIDSLALGQLRGIWASLGECAGRRLVLIRSVDCVSMLVMDGDQPSAIRAITETVELKREIMLSLLEAEDFGGAHKLEEIVIVDGVAEEPAVAAAEEPSEASEASEGSGAADEGAARSVPCELDPEELKAFAPVRKIEVGSDAALVGVAERSEDAESLNALPESWAEMLQETRFKHKLVKCVAIAGGIWLLIIAVLFGVPLGYGFMTDYQKAQSKQHERQYREVKEMKAKVVLIKKYSDHMRGALEIMKAVSDRLPESVTLSSWNYKREDGVRVTGEATVKDDAYKLKDEMEALSEGEDGEGPRIFANLEMKGPDATRNGYRFDLDCQYQKEGAE